MSKNTRLTISDFMQIPFAFVSFVFFHIVKLVMRGFVTLINNRKKGKLTPWRVISEDMIKKPLVLPVFMTKAPRWNPHAIIGVVGPLSVESSIDINTEQANGSASNWGLVMQSMENGSEQRLSSNVNDKNESWESMQLEPGHYTAALRYYGQTEDIYLPAININGQEAIAPMPVDSNNNKFYEELRDRRNWFYVLLNYYVYTMLRFSRWLPDAFVVNQYLPAGDPGMEFKYGVIEKNSELHVSLETDLLSNYEVYLTFYDRASFPVQWCQLREATMTTAPAEETGYYLIRFLLKTSGSCLAIDEHSCIKAVYKP
jgi:Family of unknown function (DUF6208)